MNTILNIIIGIIKKLFKQENVENLILNDFREKDVEGITPGSSFEKRFTPNFRYGELALDVEARRFIHQYQCNTALFLCKFLEKLRTSEIVNKSAIRITSGYRTPEINSKTPNASTTSEHLYNEPDKGGVDIFISGVDMDKVYEWLDNNWPYSLGDGRHLGFIHIGIRPGRPRVRWTYS